MKFPFTFEFKRWYVIVRGRYNQTIMGMGWAAQPPKLFTQIVDVCNQDWDDENNHEEDQDLD